MNKVYSKVWNRALGCMVVASELAKGGGSGRVQGGGFLPVPRRGVLASAVAALLALAGALHAPAFAQESSWVITDGDNDASIGPGGQVRVAGDDNISVELGGEDDAAVLEVTLGRDLEVDSVRAGATLVDTNGVRVGDSVTLGSTGLVISGGPSVTTSGIDAGGKVITNLANGEISETSTDAVTGQQVHDLFFEEGAGGVRYFRTNSTVPDSQADGDQSIAIGPQTTAGGDSSLAAGDGAGTTEDAEGAIALGQGALAGSEIGGAGSIAVGRSSVASGGSAVALGDGAEASSGNATALGAGARVSGTSGIAIGQAEATGGNSFAAGSGAFAGSPGGIALGTAAGTGTHGTEAGDKTHHIAIGSYAGQDVEGNQTTAIGYQAGSNVTGDHNVAVGSHAGESLQGDFNVAIGHEANRGAGQVERATAVGGQSDAGRNAVAVGYGAAAGDSGVALGANTTADDLGVALGRNSSADGGNIALGSASAARSSDAEGTGYLTGSTFTDGTVVSVGNTNPDGVRTTRRIVNVADGSQGYDAVNVRQLQGAQQAVANLVGGNVTVEDSGSFGGYVIELQDSGGQLHRYSTVAAAINAVSSGAISVLPGDAVIYAPDGTVTVAAGVLGDDAVNVDQLNEAVAENGAKYFSVNSSEPANRDNVNASGTNAMALGPAASADGGSSLAAGHLAHTVGNRSVALGHEVEALGNDSTAIGSGSDAYGGGAVAVGLRAKSQGENSIVMGTDAQADPKNTDATVDDAIVIGTRAEATADNGIATGESALASEERAMAHGYDAHATADDSLAFGSNSRASARNAQASGTNANASGVNAQASGTDASASGYGAIAAGTSATSYATDGIAVGTGAESGFHDPLNQDPHRNTGGIAIGNGAIADNHHALALGVAASAEAESATAVGDSARATAVDALAAGSGASATAQNASAFGQGAAANHAGSVALGSGAVTNEAVGTEGLTIDKVRYTYAGTEPVATVSVGDAGQERTITNVAAGRVSEASTDAINGSQLYGTNQALEALADDLDTAGGSVAVAMGGNAQYDPDTHHVTASNIGGTGENTIDDAIRYAAQGWNVSASGEGAVDGNNVGPSGTVDFSNTDGNIGISRDGTDLAFELADDIGVDSVTAGDTVVDTDGVRVGDDVSLDGTGLVIAGGPSVTTAGIDAGGLVITNVVAGAVNATSTDAVNGSQLFGAADSVNTIIGGNATVNPDGSLTTSDIGGTGYDTIDEAIRSANDAAAAGWTATDGQGSSAHIGPNGMVEFTGDGNVAVTQTGMDGNGAIEVTLNRDLEIDSVAAGDTQLDTDGVRIGNDVTLDGTGLVIAGGPRVTVDGIDAGGLVITNVASGAVNATSMEAINGSQLFGVADSVSTILGGNAVVNPDGSITTNDIGGTGHDTIDEAIRSANDAANAGWTATDGQGNAAHIGPNGTVEFTGDSNIAVNQSGADGNGAIEVTLNRDLDVDSIHAGDTVVDADGVRVGDDVRLDGTGLVIEGGPSVTVDGIDAGGQVVSNVAAGVEDTDAANVGQLNEGIANAIDESNAYTDGRIDQVNTAVTDLGDRMADAEGDIANLGGRVTHVEGDVGKLQAGAAGPFQVNQDAPLVGPAPTGANSAAGGNGAEASGDNAVALGNQAVASGGNSTAIGQGAQATHDNSVALGQGSATTVGAQSGYDAAYVGSSSSSGEVNVGNRTISGVAPGMAGNDAVNVNQLNAGVRHAVVTANDYTDQRFNQVQDDMWHLNNRMDGLERDINAGIATSMAMRQAPYVAGATTYYAGVGAYKGEGALGVSLRRTADNGRWSLEGGFSANNEGTGGYVGVSGVLGGK